jgi:hypothetical protein
MILKPKSGTDIKEAEEKLHSEYYLCYKIGDVVKVFYDTWWNCDSLDRYYKIGYVIGYQKELICDSDETRYNYLIRFRKDINTSEYSGQQLRPFNNSIKIIEAPIIYRQRQLIDKLLKVCSKYPDVEQTIKDTISLLKKDCISLEGRKK